MSPPASATAFACTTSSYTLPVAEVYGAAPMIFGTLVSSLIALVIAVPLALGVAIFLTEFAPKWVRQPVAFLVELLAAVPSVVYGVWGIFVLIPFLRQVAVPPLRAVLGWTPFFSGVFYGNSMLAGGVILAIMVVPYIASVSREVLLAVPATQREAALGLGATRWEAVWSAVLPYGRAGVIGAGILVPLGLHLKPASFGRLAARPLVNAAKLVLFGGFLLRVATLLASEGIARYRVAAGL